MIKVQREVKEKSTRLMELQEKYTLLESVSECVDVSDGKSSLGLWPGELKNGGKI
jgi:hypothetical protein